MSATSPRHPIAIIGAGLAGLSAAHTLTEAGIPCFILERFDRAGGRFNTREGNNWFADHGTCFLTSRNERLCNLIRAMGMETSRVAVQGGVYQLTADKTIVRPEGGGVDASRFCLAPGFGAFTRELGERFDIRTNTAVGAIRWDNNRKVFWWDSEGQVFWFEDEEGEPIRHPISHKILTASGLILATTATAARRIVEKSPSLAGLLPQLESVHYSSTFTSMFRVPRLETPWYALRGEPGAPFMWIGLEERKYPARVPGDYSLLVVHASHEWSLDLIAMDRNDAMDLVYRKLREVLDFLPELPHSQTYKRWNVALLQSPPLVPPSQRPAHKWPTNPSHIPFALAGDYVYGRMAEDAANAGHDAALSILAQLPERHSVLGLEFNN